jgi:ribosomal protein S16
MIASSESGHPIGDLGTYVPVAEPSTASKTDIRDERAELFNRKLSSVRT